jgi:hypothetical protein
LRDYQAAARILRKLSKTIDDPVLRQGYLRHPQVAGILAAARSGPGKKAECRA